MKVNCSRCGKKFDPGNPFQSGALMFSHPAGHTVYKYHICRKCEIKILSKFKDRAVSEKDWHKYTHQGGHHFGMSVPSERCIEK